MWFKNARIYNVNYSEISGFFTDETKLEEALEQTAFQPCKSQEVSSIGFAPLFGPDSAYCYRHENSFFCKLLEENKLLPASVIKNELQNQIMQREAELQRNISKNEREALKTAIQNQLLAKAFTTRREMLIWMNTATNMIVVGASSAKRAEKGLAMLRQALSSFPAKVPQPRCVVEDRMTAWLTTPEELPSQFELGTDTILKSQDDDGGVIRASREDLTSEEIAVHIHSGKVSTEVQVVYDDALSLVLGADLSMKRIKPLDQYLEKNLPEKSDDERADMQSYLIIQGQLFTSLCELLMEIFDCDRQ